MAEQVTQGNLDVKETLKSNDELGQLSKSFDYMIEHLKKTTDIENQLNLQKNLKNALDESSIVSIIDPNRLVTFVNEKFCKITKYSKEELLGTDQTILRSGVHSTKFYEDLWDVISSGSVWHGEICNKTKDGKLFWNEATIVPFSDKNGKIYEYVAIRTDITHQKDLSKKLIDIERLSAIGELAARVAHDIRNPLSVIKNSLGNIKLLKNEPENLDKTIDRCDRAVDRIAHQIDGVMGFLKESPVEGNRMSLLEIIQSAVIGIPNQEGVKIIFPIKDVDVVGDRIKLESLFYNLIINAVQKLNHNGTITINAYDDLEKILKITVSDDGESIPESSLQEIFEPLVTTKQEGTGLGLASCKKIVEQHDGSISARNNPVTFTILLPSKEIIKN
jgi:PAS domain S-box-containing protein